MKRFLQTSASRHDFPIALAASSLGTLGDMLLLTVIALRIATGDEPWRLTVVLIAFAVPLFVLAPVAGRIVDTFDSRAVLVLAGVLQAGAATWIAFSGTFPTLVAAIVLLQTGQSVSAPAWSALVPTIVGKEAVGRATGNLAAASAIAGMAGAALGGVVYTPLGFHGAVLINVAGFLLIALAGALVKTRRGRRYQDRAASPVVDRPAPIDEFEAPTPSHQNDAPAPTQAASGSGTSGSSERSGSGGWQFCRRDAVLAVLLPALWALVVAGEALNVAEVFLIRGVLGASPTLYGICGAAFLVGSIVGPLLAGRVGDDRRRIWWCAVTAGLSGGLVIAMSVSPSAWLVAVLLAVAGVLLGAFNALIVAVILVRPPDAMRGRVMATVNGTMRGFGVIALVIGGLLVQFVGARIAFAVVGALVAAAALLIRRVINAVPAPATEPVGDLLRR